VAEQARLAAAPGTDIVARTVGFGARIISTRSELAIAQHATLDALAEHAHGHDAVVIAASFDTALLAAREMLPIPVVGMTEAALLTACMLGTRIGMLVFGRRVLPLYQELVAGYGLSGRIAGWRALENDAIYRDNGADAADAQIAQAVHDLAHAHGCEVVILAGAVMAGAPARIQPRVDVPLLEGVSCAVAQAETLVRLARPKAGSGSLATVVGRASTGLSPALQARLSTPKP
jgi:allantoin racemase